MNENKKIVSGQQKFADSKKFKNETKQRPPLPLFYACEAFFFIYLFICLQRTSLNGHLK